MPRVRWTCGGANSTHPRGSIRVMLECGEGTTVTANAMARSTLAMIKPLRMTVMGGCPSPWLLHTEQVSDTYHGGHDV